jgi:hypothetical protein
VRLSSAVVALLACVASTPAFAVDWASVPGNEVVLLYPGQTSLEWVMTQADHSGATKFREGKNCHECHDNTDAKAMGPKMASGSKAEPTPIPGKPGFIDATVKVAHDDKNFYVHLDFAPGNQPDARMDKTFETKVTMMLNDGGVKDAVRIGCWASCHDDNTGMASAGTTERTKYLWESRTKRTRQGSGDSVKPDDELAKLRAADDYLEYWQARLNPGAKAVGEAGTILEKRAELKQSAVNADATFANGVWSVTLSRPLVAGAPYKDLVPGKTYTVGFAIHAGHTDGRFHYVSMERSMVLDSGSADLVAVKK